MEFYSHPDTLLKEHLKEVGIRAREYFYFENNVVDFKKLTYFIGLTHDFGKYTSFFQKKLFNDNYSSKYTDHSLISSLFSSFLILKNLHEFNIKFSIKEFLPLITIFVVIHHHSDLKSLDYLSDILSNSENLEKIKAQTEDILNNKDLIEKELNEIGVNLNLEEFSYSLEFIIDEIKREIYLYSRLDENLKIEFSFLVLALFSSLIDADKKSAGKISDIERVEIPSNIIDRYKEIKFKNSEKNKINQIRDEIYNKVLYKIETLDLSKKIYTLTSPTGSGKTLTSFSFAFKLKKKLNEKYGYIPRIIYSLPFISIINQNFNVLEDVLKLIENFEGNKSKYLIAHHHLANTKYEEGNEFKEIDESIELIESWESEIIVTTFVQFLETIIGFKNRFLKKYHNIAKSIIILDEVQNIPVEYWNIIEKMIDYLSNYLNCYIILMTATKPLIFRNTDTVELLDDNESYFRFFDRVNLYPKLDLISFDKLIDFFLEIYKNNLSRSYMFVLNTIDSSIILYKKLKEIVSDVDIFYLSSNIIPKERSKRINIIIDKIKNKQKVILVSTQVIEAGVDISFDFVFRDIAPFDSIIQVSGRCNREFKNEKGSVFVVKLLNDKGNTYTTYVYGKISPESSFKILKDLEIIEEKDFYNYINQYFYDILSKKSQDISEKIYESFLNLIFYDSLLNYSVSNFKIIKDENTYPIFIELDDEAELIWQKYKKIIEDKTLKPWEKKVKIYEFKDKFESYIVSIRVNEKNFKILEVAYDEYLGYVPKTKVKDYYDLETGFIKRKGLDLIW